LIRNPHGSSNFGNCIAPDLNPSFASLSDPYHLLVFNLLLKTGLREQEAIYLEWPDISFTTKTLTIHSKLALHSIAVFPGGTYPLGRKFALSDR
jgi:integrase